MKRNQDERHEYFTSKNNSWVPRINNILSNQVKHFKKSVLDSIELNLRLEPTIFMSVRTLAQSICFGIMEVFRRDKKNLLTYVLYLFHFPCFKYIDQNVCGKQEWSYLHPASDQTSASSLFITVVGFFRNFFLNSTLSVWYW